LARPRFSFKIYSLGCKVNQYDGQSIREKLVAAGLREAADNEQAGLCVVNTCTVTASADKDSLYQLRRFRRDNPRAKIIMTGCAAPGVRRMIPGVDGIIPNSNKKKFISVIRKRFPQLFQYSVAGPPETGETISFFKGHTRAFLKIQDGCDNFCTYCKVPFVRGRPESKPREAIREEAQVLSRNGYKEIVLTGICLGKYGHEGHDLVDAIEAIEALEGITRIRLSSIELVHVTSRLITALKNSEKLCSHLHIPMQSGDDSILKKDEPAVYCASVPERGAESKECGGGFRVDHGCYGGFSR
jgi:threonylcarbamoyladenosine tRNA methylthiotransferase MtaB